MVEGRWPKKKIRGVKINAHPHLLSDAGFFVSRPDWNEELDLLLLMASRPTKLTGRGLNRRIERARGVDPRM